MSKPHAREAATGGGVVEAVNFNSPGQVVIAGERPRCCAPSRSRRRAAPSARSSCPSACPSHSSLMKSAGARLARAARHHRVRAPRDSLSERRRRAGTSAIPTTSARCSSASCRARCAGRRPSPPSPMAASKHIVECGPGGVLAGLVKRITRGGETQTAALETPESFATAISAVAA